MKRHRYLIDICIFSPFMKKEILEAIYKKNNITFVGQIWFFFNTNDKVIFLFFIKELFFLKYYIYWLNH